ncbi:hypothetical protein HZF05_18340 [Sphingomonas sp. CGMCC 1.13654]|uniref:Uncharacterized protein n=1 Tax=Sphingomonas chungangi TaxID=2683589 RepID=A0A838LBG1_9SPHN|nr:hypothetical protein [Sphingomonas chungangi]MBA2936045.1 hypothetical protein [Sphingomonas chungangi]MVW55434.1 hypothetical protein [Sphingomonas chungangi]
MKPVPLLVLAGCLTLPGCVVHTAYDVATEPVRVGSKVVDWSTTSQSEADRNRGRKMRKEQARQEKEARRQAKRRREQGYQSPY